MARLFTHAEALRRVMQAKKVHMMMKLLKLCNYDGSCSLSELSKAWSVAEQA
jgi:hypothetical protein